MRLIFIRHGDPDYVHDSLTEKGFREAEYLSDYLMKFDIDDCYVSSLGRAKATAKPYLEKSGKSITECEWLKEFSPRINRPDTKDRTMICWDWLPQDLVKVDEFYDYRQWTEPEVMAQGKVKEEYVRVTSEFNKLLSSYGYEKEGRLYRVKESNDKTIVFFCHYGITCALLADMLSVSPMILWHGFVAAPSSLTIVNTEERRQGYASFRICEYGDITHLRDNGEEASFQARFCTRYENTDQRHD